MPVDCYGSKKAPEVVIRQVGNEGIQVWDLKNARVLTLFDLSKYSLISSFDPEKTFYMFEPGSSIFEPEYYGISIPALITTSPDKRRYKEFAKNGGIYLRMPTWTLEELQAVRKYLADHCKEKFSLTSKDIESRFKEFGGNFRHIFAPDITKIRKYQNRAIAYLEIFPYFQSHEQHQVFLDVCENLAQYRVTMEGPEAFMKAEVELISEQVENKIRQRFSDSDANKKIEYLKLIMP